MSEYSRRAVHATGVGMPLIYLLEVVSWDGLRYFMLAVTGVVFGLEFLRLGLGVDHWLYDELTREYEQGAIAGYALYMASMTAVALLFEPVVTLPAMLMLIVADPISGMLGENAADEHKRPAVVAITFGLCFVLAAPFTVGWAGGPVGTAAAVAGAAGGAIADGVKPVIRGVAVDDNLTIPTAAVCGIVGVFWLFGVDVGFDPLAIWV